VVICLEQSADLHTAQLMLLPLTVSCFSKIQIGFTFLVPAYLGSPGQRAVKRVCVCVHGSIRPKACISYPARRRLVNCDVMQWASPSRTSNQNPMNQTDQNTTKQFCDVNIWYYDALPWQPMLNRLRVSNPSCG